MAARRRPTAEDAATATRLLLSGLAADTDIFDILAELAVLHPRDNTFPGEVFLRIGAEVLDQAGVTRADPLPYEGLLDRYLGECQFRGRENRKIQYALLATAALHGGVDPDLLDEVVWWRTDDFWEYATYATIVYIRAAAERRTLPVRRVCEEIAASRGLTLGDGELRR